MGKSFSKKRSDKMSDGFGKKSTGSKPKRFNKRDILNSYYNKSEEEYDNYDRKGRR
jgi:hypothetical protein